MPARPGQGTEMGAFGNQVALVSGASRGIGNAIALALAAQGATVALVGRDEHALRETAAQARATSPHVESYITDLTNDEAVRDLQARVDSDFGDVDIVVHAAGVIIRSPSSEQVSG